MTRNQGRKSVDRQSPEEFFNAAIKILGEQGPDRLTVKALCERIGVTKGSFYHHFAGMEQFVTALMLAWTGTLEDYIGTVAAETDPVRQLEGAIAAWINTPHEAEGAIRAWARSNSTVAAAVMRQDQFRERVSAEWLSQFVEDPERCRLLAHMGACMTTGMQGRPPPIDRELLVDACVEFVRMVAGVEIRKEQTSAGLAYRLVPPGA